MTPRQYSENVREVLESRLLPFLVAPIVNLVLQYDDHGYMGHPLYRDRSVRIQSCVATDPLHPGVEQGFTWLAHAVDAKANVDESQCTLM